MTRPLIVDVDPPSPTYSRVVVGLLGVLHMAVARATIDVVYTVDPVWVWPMLFVLAGIGCFHYSINMSPRAAVAAGALTAAAYAARCGMLLIAWQDGTKGISTAQLVAGLAVFGTVLLGWVPSFYRVTVPFAYRERYRRALGPLDRP